MTRGHGLTLTAVLAVIALPCVVRSAETVDFNRDIRSLLSNYCYKCHGPDDKERKGGSDGLRLDTPEGAYADQGGTRAIVPGRPDESELIRRVTATDPDEQMPPPSTGWKLTAADIDRLTEWIRQGGSYARHWSYAPPVRPPLPEVRAASWPRNAIDRFLLARLEREGLEPSELVDRYALIRRVSLDLTGLPPTLEDVNEFVRDDGVDAYERLVERLLSKETFGEHWARMWLDLARYADSAGYADDPTRTIWAYRDYVIRSFNANKPFDQFTLEQLAGDLLPNPSHEQLMATAFHRNTLTNSEGGTNDEEFRSVAIVDRVNTTWSVWMGTSMTCAQCHNHKYDPISQTEFFRFYAILNNTEDADRRDESPLLEFYTADQQQQRSKWESEIRDLEQTLKTPTPAILTGMRAWDDRYPREITWQQSQPVGVTSSAGAATTIQADQTILVAAGQKSDTYEITLPLAVSKLSALRIEALPHESLPKHGPGHADGRFVVSRIAAEVVPPESRARPVVFASAWSTVTRDGFDPQRVLQSDSKTPETANGWANSPLGDGSGAPGAVVLSVKALVDVAAGSTLKVTIEQQSQSEQHTLGCFRVSVTDDARLAEFAHFPGNVSAILSQSRADRSADRERALTEFYLAEVAPELQTTRDQLAKVRKQFESIKPNTVPIMRELAGDQRRVTHLQYRGNYLDLGPEVNAGTPAIFQPTSGDQPPDRLAMARWLVDPANPLTPRVIANRFWEQIFGIGLVRTSEEFGAQGELPSHPELLDWLAVELVESGWNVKHFLTLLVTSAAYRQSSQVLPELAERDPENRLLARGPRFRLSAEMVRDQALFVSGLLSTKMYGPSVKPPQPALGLNAAFGSAIDWKTSDGEDRFRRGLYTEWRRSNPYPSMITFDAPNREVCTLRRARTNTPLQALVTLNDPVYIECAQALARRIHASGTTAAERATYAFRVCLARTPYDRELQRIVSLYEESRDRFSREPDQAKEMATNPLGKTPPDTEVSELAAWTVVANVLLNLDEMLMKR